ncbi:MAG: hypothetical protein ACLU9S_10390 [Oscillospiraceae bacterium]
MAETDTVVTISAGNNGYWAENSRSVAGTLYGDDVRLPHRRISRYLRQCVYRCLCGQRRLHRQLLYRSR